MPTKVQKNVSRAIQIILDEVKCPTKKLHFKLGFPIWYLESFKVNFSVILQFSSQTYQKILFKGYFWSLKIVPEGQYVMKNSSDIFLIKDILILLCLGGEGGGEFKLTPPCGLKNVSPPVVEKCIFLREGGTLAFLKISLNFLKSFKRYEEILWNFSYFHQFPQFFGCFDITLLQRN